MHQQFLAAIVISEVAIARFLYSSLSSGALDEIHGQTICNMTLCFQRSHSLLQAEVNLGKFYALQSLFQHVDNHISSIYSQPLIQESSFLQFKIRYAKGLFLVSLILQVSLIQHIIYILLLLHESFVHLKIFSQKNSNKVLSSMLVISFSFFFYYI